MADKTSTLNLIPLGGPFCGTIPSVYETVGLAVIACRAKPPVCAALVETIGATKADAIKRWNTRPGAPRIAVPVCLNNN